MNMRGIGTDIGVPLGHIRIVKSAASVAGNVATTIQPGAGKRWKVLSLRVKVVADGTAANRYVDLTETDGTDTLLQYCENSTAITANETKYVNFLSGFSSGETDAVQADDLMLTALGTDCLLDGTALSFVLTLRNGVAGDAYDYYLVVLEIPV